MAEQSFLELFKEILKASEGISESDEDSSNMRLMNMIFMEAVLDKHRREVALNLVGDNASEESFRQSLQEATAFMDKLRELIRESIQSRGPAIDERLESTARRISNWRYRHDT